MDSKNLVLAIALLVFFSRPASAQIFGYREAKFGMTAEQLVAAHFCATHLLYDTQNLGSSDYIVGSRCFKVFGEDRDAHFEFGKNGLEVITVQFGRFSPEAFRGLRSALNEQYREFRDFTQKQAQEFDSGVRKDVLVLFAGGQVALRVWRVQSQSVVGIMYARNAEWLINAQEGGSKKEL